MHSYLALGDSYTIGEAVPSAENFPNQAVALLRRSGVDIADPVIIATTGWTTDELAAAIHERALQESFSLVSLLIGVNNQYRSRSLENYREEFQMLLNQAIIFAGGHARHVVVLSIPDWGQTPFAMSEASRQRNPQAIGTEIDAFNAAAKGLSLAHRCAWLDITESTRQNAKLPGFLAEDGLHPSGREYAIWAAKLAPVFAHILTA